MPAIKIPLSRGAFAFVDEEDAQSVGRYAWHLRPSGKTSYAVRSVTLPDGKRIGLTMHAFLAGYPITDHINGNGLDNRRSNLREVTKQQNSVNTRKRSGTSSRFKGVAWDKRSMRWHAYIRLDGHSRYLGYFEDEDDAARAYDASARVLFGEFAALNFPEAGEQSALIRESPLLDSTIRISEDPRAKLATRCKRGHAFDESNTYWTKSSRPKRRCRRCSALSYARWVSRHQRRPGSQGAMRAWAQASGLQIARIGAIPTWIRNAYERELVVG